MHKDFRPHLKKMAHIENEMESNNEDERDVDLSLHDAVYEGSFDEMIKVFGENPNLVFITNNEGQNPLHYLIIRGHQAVDIVELFLGVEKSSDGQSIKNIKRATLLESTDSKGLTPLHYSAKNCLPILVDCFLKLGANPLVQDIKGNLPLHLTVQVDTYNALECVKTLLKYDKDGSMINAKNSDENTPLNVAVKMQAVQMVELLLHKEYKLNLSTHLKKSGQSILHFICFEPGESEKSSKMLKSVLKRCDASYLNQSDENSRTALHICGMERLPELTEALLSNSEIDVMKIDNRKRTALHYATENGSYPNGYRCVELLISHKFTDSNKWIEYLYQMKDDHENTAFQYGCMNCPVSTMQKYLSTIPEPRFWMTELSMTLIYKQCPLAIKALMDRAFSEHKMKVNDPDHDHIFVDFGPITGYTDPVEKSPQQETKYLKQALWWDFDTQKEILMHPLLQLFVTKKCQKLNTIIFGWIMWQLMWLGAYTLLVVSYYINGIDSKAVTYAAAFVMIIYAVSFLPCTLLFEVYVVQIASFISFTNLSQLVQIILAFLVIFPVVAGNEPQPWNKHAAAIGTLLAYILSMRDIGKMHEEIGLVVEVLKQVVIQIIKVLLCCAPLLLGFTISFAILFDDQATLNSTFPGPLVKVLVMMTGEFEYNDMFNGEDKNPKTTYTAIRLVFFLSFLIAIPVAFYNLLTGFALDRVLELRERAKVGRIAKQLEHIYFIESILLSLSPLKKMCSHDSVVLRLRKYNVTTATIDGEVRFETILKEETRKKLDRRTFKGKRLQFWKCATPICGTELPPEVRKQIFVLASSSKMPEKADAVFNSSCPNCQTPLTFNLSTNSSN